MKDLYRLLVLVFSGGVSILDPSIGFSQTYPVHVTTTIAPPYSVYLSDYASAESNSLNVLLNVLELDRTNLRVKLRVTIDGAGITLRTRAGYLPPAIVLQGGVPELLTGFDLRTYFNADNLDFSGITKAQFLQTGKLPEGFYTFRIEVLEYTRNVLISSPIGGQASAWVVLNDPPLINMPFKDDKVRATDPQNVLFSWTPRHTASPNAAFSTEYEFRLVEMYPGQTNPDAAIRSSNSIYTTKTTLTSLNYGIVEPILTPGKHYAFRIRAYDTSGRDLFKNSGYSETYHFQYGDNCILPANISAEALDPNRVKVTWETDQVHSKFKLDFRKTGLRDWETNETFLASQIYPELTPATAYEYRLQAVCGSISGNPSAIFTVTTLKENEVPAGKTKFSCGADSPTLPEHEGSCTIPLAKPLLPLDVIKAGDLNVIVSQAILQPDGSYTGKGHVPLPMFNAASFRVILRNVMINEHYRLMGGSIKTVYDETNRPMGDVEKEMDDLAKERDQLDGESGDTGTSGDVASWSADVTTPVTGEIQEVTVNDDGTITVAFEDGTTQSVSAAGEGQTQAITDSSGDAWLVDSKGNVTPIPAGSSGSGGSSSPALASKDQAIDFVVNFESSAFQNYGFDAFIGADGKKLDVIASDYTKEKVNDKDYWVAWKSVASGATDLVGVKVSNDKAFPDYVGFKNSTGNLTSRAGSDSHHKLVTISGTDQTITAYAKKLGEDSTEQEIVVGQLKVASYDLIRNKVIVVPVNDVVAPAAGTLEQELNAIYGQAVAQWEVVINNSFKVDPDLLKGMDDGESGMLASFPDKMREFNRQFKKSTNLDNNAYYVFLISGSGSSRSGFMPFKREFGYIFTDKSSNVTKTIAHELGHGAFRLRHTFSSEAFIASQGSTDNLMDYSSTGTKLFKRQWNNVHDPESMVGWMQEDDESADMTYRQDVEWVVEIYSPWYSEQILNASKANNQTDIKKWIDQALKKTFTVEQIKSLGNSTFLPKLEDGSVPIGIIKHYPNAEVKELYLYYTKRDGTKIIANPDPLIFKDSYPVDLTLHNGKFDNVGSANSKEEVVSELETLAYDFVWETMTQRSWTDEMRNWFKEIWSYPSVDRDEELIGYFMKFLPGTEPNINYQYFYDAQVAYAYEFELEPNVKTPLAFYILGDKPSIMRQNLVDYKLNDKYSVLAFCESNDIKKPQVLVQLAKDKVESFKNYLRRNEMGPVFEIEEDIVESVATRCTEQVKSNPEIPDYTCNMCVRDAFYKITGKTILYSGTENRKCLCCDPEENNIEGGLVVGNGTANSIYSNLTDPNSELAKHFQEIFDMPGEDYPNFGQMQEDAEGGQLIIGVKDASIAGHIVLLMPEDLWEANSQLDKPREISLNNGNQTETPIALECGQGENKRVQPLRWGSITLKSVRWFKYVGI